MSTLSKSRARVSPTPLLPVVDRPSGAAPQSVCVLIPCLDEEKGIGAVIEDFRRVLPDARIVVVDNDSKDATAEVARRAGADAVLSEGNRGKAQAVLTAFHHIDADLVIMVDGDGSYPAEGARRLLERYARDPADMITGVRVANEAAAFRALHQLGTRAFETVLWMVFGYQCDDLFSGLRLFTRQFYLNAPILSRGFELELEFTVQAIDKGFRMAEIPVPFQPRAEGSQSKLRSVRDGLLILRALLVLFRDYRPMRFFGFVSGAFFGLSLLAGSVPVYEYWQTQLVGRFPLAFLAASLMVIAFFTFQTGVILESSLRYHREALQVRLRSRPRGERE